MFRSDGCKPTPRRLTGWTGRMSIATNAKCYQGEMEKDAQVRYVKEKDSERGAEYEHLE